MKTPSNKELLAGDKLQSLSQETLLSLVESNQKVGIVINNRISIAMLKWDNYEGLLNTLVTQENRISELESQFEDLILAVNDSAAIHTAESGQTKEYEVDNLNEVLELLHLQSNKNDPTESDS